jgi:hypothetical protein
MTTGAYDKRRLIEWLRAETARATGRRNGQPAFMWCRAMKAAVREAFGAADCT